MPECSDFAVNDASTATLSASPGSVCAESGTVTVQWAGVAAPLSNDWVGIYSPATSASTDYLDFFWANVAPTWARGFGSVNVTLLNMRQNYQFRYFSNNTAYVLQATSNVVGMCSIPMQGHIALTGDNTQMRVMWTSATSATPVVSFGTSPEALNRVAKGTSLTYAATDMCGSPANVTAARRYRNPGYIHDVLLTNLTPGVPIYYQFGTVDVQSPLYAFVAAPPVGPVQPVSFFTYGDMGDGLFVPDAAKTAMRVLEGVGAVNFVLHVGDISYARSVGWIWELFFHLIEPIAVQVPYMVGVGNHEYDHVSGGEHDPSGAPGVGFHPSWGNYGDDSAGECARPFFSRFHMPDNGNALFWYSFDYGSAHIVHISSEHDFTPGSPQFAWLEQDLKAVDRAVTPWLIVASHRPMYCSENYQSDYVVSLNLRSNLEELLYAAGVDLVLTGHYHAYERTCRVYNGTCRDDGILHVVNGAAGAWLDDASYMNVSWSLSRTYQLGYGIVNITADPQQGTTSLLWQFVLDETNQVFDQVTLTKRLASPA